MNLSSEIIDVCPRAREHIPSPSDRVAPFAPTTVYGMPRDVAASVGYAATVNSKGIGESVANGENGLPLRGLRQRSSWNGYEEKAAPKRRASCSAGLYLPGTSPQCWSERAPSWLATSIELAPEITGERNRAQVPPVDAAAARLPRLTGTKSKTSL